MVLVYAHIASWEDYNAKALEFGVRGRVRILNLNVNDSKLTSLTVAEPQHGAEGNEGMVPPKVRS